MMVEFRRQILGYYCALSYVAVGRASIYHISIYRPRILFSWSSDPSGTVQSRVGSRRAGTGGPAVMATEAAGGVNAMLRRDGRRRRTCRSITAASSSSSSS